MKCKYLVLSSGGLKCLTFLGHLKYVNNDLSELKAISGCSAGALIGFLLCMHTPSEIVQLLHDPDNIIFRSEDLKLSNLMKYYGLNNGEHIRKFLQNVLHKYCSKTSINFEEFYNKTNVDLFVCTTNVHTQSCEIFSKYISPHEDVINCVMMSLCIPLYFVPIMHNNHYYIDGAFYNPVPYEIINETYDIDDNLKKSVHIYYVYDKTVPLNISSLFDYITFLGYFVRNSLVKKQDYDMYTSFKFDTCDIPFINHKYKTPDYLKIIDNVI